MRLERINRELVAIGYKFVQYFPDIGMFEYKEIYGVGLARIYEKKDIFEVQFVGEVLGFKLISPKTKVFNKENIAASYRLFVNKMVMLDSPMVHNGL